MSYAQYIYDGVAVLVLLIFCVRGWKKGLLLTICSLLAFFVALIGARAAADRFTPAVADALQPRIAASIEKSLSSGGTAAAAASSSAQESGAIGSILDSLGLSGLNLKKNVLEQVSKAVGSAGAALSWTLADTVARVLVFCVSFLVILAAWFLVSRALDLTTHLPVIHSMNRFLGGLFGLAEGMLILFLAARLFGGLIPKETVEKTLLLRFFFQTDSLHLLPEI